MADIFGRDPQSYGGGVSADATTITFQDAGGTTGITGSVGLLGTQLQLQYQVPVTRIYELGSRNFYYVVGRARGEGQMARILGPRPLQLAFYATYGNPCSTGSLIFTIAAGCVAGDAQSIANTVHLTCTGILIDSLGFQANSENFIINENVHFQFVAMIPGT